MKITRKPANRRGKTVVVADKKIKATVSRYEWQTNPRFVQEEGVVSFSVRGKVLGTAQYEWTLEFHADDLGTLIEAAIDHASNDDDGVRAHGKSIGAYIRAILASRKLETKEA
jgi:hypothetical protein